MPIPDLILKDSKLVLDSHENVVELEQDLWIKMPPGYLEFVTRYGEGSIDCFLRIYPSWRIAKELLEWRQRINKYWFWDSGKKTLPKARALECIVIGDTMTGDEVIFHPTRPNTFFILPRNRGSIFQVDGDLDNLINWVFTSKKLINEKTVWDFGSFDSRKTKKEKGDVIIDPEGESFDEIVAIAKKWLVRHKKEYSPTIKKASSALGDDLRRQEPILDDAEYCFVVIPQKNHDPELKVMFKIYDKESKKPLGRLHVNIDEGTSSYEFSSWSY